MRRLLNRVGPVLLCALVAACSNSPSRLTSGAPSSQLSEVTTSSVPPTSIQPTTSSVPATSIPPTTTLDNSTLTVRPGEQLAVDISVMSYRDGRTRRVPVWLSKPAGREGLLGPETFLAGVAGYVDIGTSDRVTAQLTIPRIMGVRAGFRPVELIATPIGTYTITLAIYETAGRLEVRVISEGELSTSPPALSREAAPQSRRLLNDDGIGDIRFGTPENDALQGLIVLFGAPEDDTGWREGCVDNRAVTWGALTVWFRTDQYGRFTDGYFAAYIYARVDDKNLASTTGVLIGDSLDDLRALIPSMRFKTAYESLVVDQFLVGSEMNSGLEGDLSADATDPAAHVTSIVSGLPRHHPHNVC